MAKKRSKVIIALLLSSGIFYSCKLGKSVTDSRISNSPATIYNENLPVSASPAHSDYPSSQFVSLTTSSEGGVIHFTIDGSTPSRSSPIVSGPIFVGFDQTIKVLLVSPNGLDVGLKSFSYKVSRTPNGAPELQLAPGEKSDVSVSVKNTVSSAQQSLITYCAKETANTSTAEQKKWLDAFSFEVMERICEKEVDIAKNWRSSRYLETSWAHGLNLTGVDNGVPRGTAITPRHVVYTKHYGFHGQVGETIWFLTMDNRWVFRKIVAVKYLANTDVAVARLDADLPGSITPLKVLDPAAYSLIPDLIPVLRIDQKSKALLVLKKGVGFKQPGESFGTLLINPPERAYEQYYQGMIRFDSSSPSILLLRTEHGVMPILYGLVTFGGDGNGPFLHEWIKDIESVIASFGDSHQLEKAMPPVTQPSAPSCSVSFVRKADGITCEVTVDGSADPVTGNPALLPMAPSSWSRQKNSWRAEVTCPSDPSAFFLATLSGPGGGGRGCESAPVGLVLPQCSLAASRIGSTEVCNVTVSTLIGSPSSTPVLSPVNPTDWAKSGNDWVAKASCTLNAPTMFAAKLLDANGLGPECRASVDVFSEIPKCKLEAKRNGFTDTCEVIVEKTSGLALGSPVTTPLNPENWRQEGTRYVGTVTCPVTDPITFTARFSGAYGDGTICKSPSVLSVPFGVPFCDLKAERQGLTNRCTLTAIRTRGFFVSGPPVAYPRNPSDWQVKRGTSDYEGSVGCAYNVSHQFTAQLPGLSNVLGPSCSANIVEKIPEPLCKLEVVRQGLTDQCSYTLSAQSPLGTNSSYNFDGGSVKLPWDGSSEITGVLTCSQTVDTNFKSHIWGIGDNPQTGSCSASVSKIGDIPSAPRNLQASEVGSGFVKLRWDLPSTTGGLTPLSYVVDISRDGGVSWSQFGDNTDGTTQSVVSGLANGVTYSFRVAAKNILGESGHSAVISAAPRGAPPEAPRNLTTTPLEGKVELRWEAPLNTGGYPIKDYVITFARDNAASNPIFQYYDDGVSMATSAVVTGLEAGVPYQFQVAASNTYQSFDNFNGVGVFSPSARATPLSPTPVVTDRFMIGNSLNGRQILESEDKQFKLFIDKGKVNIIQQRLPAMRRRPWRRSTIGIELSLQSFIFRGKTYDRFVIKDARGLVRNDIRWIPQGPSFVKLDNDGRLRAYLTGGGSFKKLLY